MCFLEKNKQVCGIGTLFHEIPQILTLLCGKILDVWLWINDVLQYSLLLLCYFLYANMLHNITYHLKPLSGVHLHSFYEKVEVKFYFICYRNSSWFFYLFSPQLHQNVFSLIYIDVEYTFCFNFGTNGTDYFPDYIICCMRCWKEFKDNVDKYKLVSCHSSVSLRLF